MIFKVIVINEACVAGAKGRMEIKAQNGWGREWCSPSFSLLWVGPGMVLPSFSLQWVGPGMVLPLFLSPMGGAGYGASPPSPSYRWGRVWCSPSFSLLWVGPGMVLPLFLPPMGGAGYGAPPLSPSYGWGRAWCSPSFSLLWVGPGMALPLFLPPLLTPSTKANINEDTVMSNQVCLCLQNPGTKKKNTATIKKEKIYYIFIIHNCSETKIGSPKQKELTNTEKYYKNISVRNVKIAR